MSKRTKLAPGQERSLNVSLKSLRNPPLDVLLRAQPLTTSLHDVKAALAAQTRLPADKLRLLHNKKPVPDSRALGDLVGVADTTLELGVMVMGGAKPAEEPVAAAAAGPTAQGKSGREVVESSEFWDDLRGFLLQRVRDEKVTDELFSLFLRSWEERDPMES
jgi:ubiquitin-like protein 4